LGDKKTNFSIFFAFIQCFLEIKFAHIRLISLEHVAYFDRKKVWKCSHYISLLEERCSEINLSFNNYIVIAVITSKMPLSKL